MYVYTYTYIYICVYACARIPRHIWTHTFTCGLCVYGCVYIYVYHICVFIDPTCVLQEFTAADRALAKRSLEREAEEQAILQESQMNKQQRRKHLVEINQAVSGQNHSHGRGRGGERGGRGRMEEERGRRGRRSMRACACSVHLKKWPPVCARALLDREGEPRRQGALLREAQHVQLDGPEGRGRLGGQDLGDAQE